MPKALKVTQSAKNRHIWSHCLLVWAQIRFRSLFKSIKTAQKYFFLNFKIATDELNVVVKDQYLALPLEVIGEDRYRATLVIQQIQESEQKFDHMLKISTRLRKDAEPIHSVTHRWS